MADNNYPGILINRSGTLVTYNGVPVFTIANGTMVIGDLLGTTQEIDFGAVTRYAFEFLNVWQACIITPNGLFWNDNTDAMHMTINSAGDIGDGTTQGSFTNLTSCGHVIAINTNGTPTLSAFHANTTAAFQAGSNDHAGSILFSFSGTVAAYSVLATLTFASAYGTTPIVMLSVTSNTGDTSPNNLCVVSAASKSTTGFSVQSLSAQTSGTTCRIDYVVIGLQSST